MMGGEFKSDPAVNVQIMELLKEAQQIILDREKGVNAAEKWAKMKTCQQAIHTIMDGQTQWIGTAGAERLEKMLKQADVEAKSPPILQGVASSSLMQELEELNRKLTKHIEDMTQPNNTSKSPKP